MRAIIPATFSALLLAACQAPPAAPPAATGAAAPLSKGPFFRLLADEPGASPSALDVAPAVTVGPDARVGLRVTVYQEDLGLVEDERRVDLPPGTHRLRFTEVATSLEPSTVRLGGPEGPTGVRVREQRYAFDVVSTAALLARYVGRQVFVRLPGPDGGPPELVPATLVSAADGGIVRIDGRIYLEAPGELVVPELPPGLVPMPTLEWLLAVPSGVVRTLAASYLTGGLGWAAHYDLVLAEAPQTAELAAWAAITNRSGAAYPEARVTLVAGQPNRVFRPVHPVPYLDSARSEDGGLRGRPLDVYRAYELPGTPTLGENETRQIAFFPATRIAVTRKHVFDGDRQGAGAGPSPVRAIVIFENREADGLGRHLPAGIVRVVTHEGGSLRFLGEDRIPHTPPGERVRIDVGAATGVTAERRTLSFQRIGEGRVRTRAEVVLGNATGAAVAVEVVEHPVGDWRVVASSHPAERVSANELRFTVPVPAGGEARLTWTLERVTAPPTDGEVAER